MQRELAVHGNRTTPLLWIALAGCNGSLREKPGQSEVDGSVLMAIPPPICDEPVSVTESGRCRGGESPGSDCLTCHHQGGDATPYTFAGTLYDAAGTQPVAGAKIYIQDSAGNTAIAITGTTGNFFTSDGFVNYPAKAFVSLCPSVIEMLSPVDEVTGASCNTAGCHTSGFRVHVP